MKTADHFSELWQHGNAARKISPQEDAARWGPMFSRAAAYDETFEWVEDKRLLDLVEGWKREGRALVAADLMSYGAVLDDLGVDFGVAVALTDLGSPKLKQIESIDAKPRIFIPGTILSKQTFRKINDWLKTLPVEDAKFNLILCRPAALDHTVIPSNRDYYYFLGQSMYSILSPQEGILFTQVPRDADRVFQQWIPLVERAGIDICYAPPPPIMGTGKLRLIRHSFSPTVLPVMPT